MKSKIIKSTRADSVVRKFPVASNDFSKALCMHLGLPLDMTDTCIQMHTSEHEVFAVTLKVCLNADDIAGIARHMQSLAAERLGQNHPAS